LLGGLPVALLNRLQNARGIGHEDYSKTGATGAIVASDRPRRSFLAFDDEPTDRLWGFFLQATSPTRSYGLRVEVNPCREFATMVRQ